MQITLVILTISAAVGYLTWQFYKRFFTTDSGCDGCSIGKTAK